MGRLRKIGKGDWDKVVRRGGWKLGERSISEVKGKRSFKEGMVKSVKY